MIHRSRGTETIESKCPILLEELILSSKEVFRKNPWWLLAIYAIFTFHPESSDEIYGQKFMLVTFKLEARRSLVR